MPLQGVIVVVFTFVTMYTFGNVNNVTCYCCCCLAFIYLPREKLFLKTGLGYPRKTTSLDLYSDNTAKIYVNFSYL